MQVQYANDQSFAQKRIAVADVQALRYISHYKIPSQSQQHKVGILIAIPTTYTNIPPHPMTHSHERVCTLFFCVARIHNSVFNVARIHASIHLLCCIYGQSLLLLILHAPDQFCRHYSRKTRCPSGAGPRRPPAFQALQRLTCSTRTFFGSC
jgi:hypothetical protein